MADSEYEVCIDTGEPMLPVIEALLWAAETHGAAPEVLTWLLQMRDGIALEESAPGEVLH